MSTDEPPGRPLRIFLSSPGDVAEERTLAREVLQRLQRSPLLKGKVDIEVVSWDDPDSPTRMVAAQAPQTNVNRERRPSECDLTVVILWSRMGTPLSEPRKADGSRYLSGTEWEYEDAVNAGKEVLVYRRTAKVTVDLDHIDDPEVQEQLRQRKLVGRFFERFKSPDGTLTGDYTTYETPSELEKRLAQDVESYLRDQLDGIGEVQAPPDPLQRLLVRRWFRTACAVR